MVIEIRARVGYGFGWVGSPPSSAWEDTSYWHLFNINSFTTSAALTEICALLCAILAFFVNFSVLMFMANSCDKYAIGWAAVKYLVPLIPEVFLVRSMEDPA